MLYCILLCILNTFTNNKQSDYTLESVGIELLISSSLKTQKIYTQIPHFWQKNARISPLPYFSTENPASWLL